MKCAYYLLPIILASGFRCYTMEQGIKHKKQQHEFNIYCSGWSIHPRSYAFEIKDTVMKDSFHDRFEKALKKMCEKDYYIRELRPERNMFFDLTKIISLAREMEREEAKEQKK